MEVFIALFVYLFVIGLLSYKINDKSKRRKFQSILSGLGMWLVLAFRSPLCGVDLYDDTPGSVSYFSVFKDVQNYSLFDCFDIGWISRTGMDLGWIVYNKILSCFTGSFQMLLATTSLVEIYLLGKIIHKFSSHIVLSYIVFFTMGIFLASFSTLRQIMALSITSYSFIYVLEKKFAKFASIVFLAALFHFSALLFLIIYPLSKIHINKRLGLWALALIIISIPFLNIIIQTISQVLLGGLRSADTDKGGAYSLFVLYIIIYLMTLSLDSSSTYKNNLKLFMLFAVAGQSLGSISTGHLTRVAFYFSIFFTLSIPHILDYYIEEKYRRITIIVLSLFLFSFFCYVSKDGYLNVVPYSFFWEVKHIV